MHIQIVTFQLSGDTDAEFRKRADDRAHAFAYIPGLVSKTWLANAATNTYGGVYLWHDRAAMEAYLVSPIFAAVRTNSKFVNLTTIDFEVLLEATRVTRGMPEVAA